MSGLTFDEHAAASRHNARERGLADSIHYAPRATSRADALYSLADATGLPWWHEAQVGLLPDGRMVVTSPLVSVFEAKS